MKYQNRKMCGGLVLINKVLTKQIIHKWCMLKPMKVRVMMLEVREVSRDKESNFSWTDINSFQSICKMFSDVQKTQSDYSFHDMMTIFQNIFNKEHIITDCGAGVAVSATVYSSMWHKFMGLT
jgi:hypothetical protein